MSSEIEVKEVKEVKKSTTYSEKVSYHLIVGDKLESNLKEFISNTLRDYPDILTKVELALDEIVKDGKIDSSDVPTFMILIMDLSFSFNTKTINTYEIIRTIAKTLFDIYIEENYPDNESLKLLGEKLIDSSITLLKTTIPTIKKSFAICCKH